MTTPPLRMHGWNGAQKSAPSERRRAPRVWVDLEVDFLDGDTWRPCHLLDVSATGMMLATDTALAKHSPHLVEHYGLHFTDVSSPDVRSPDVTSRSHVVEVIARSIWQRGELRAARFVALEDGASQALLDLVRTSNPGAGSDVERIEFAEGIDARARRLAYHPPTSTLRFVGAP